MIAFVIALYGCECMLSNTLNYLQNSVTSITLCLNMVMRPENIIPFKTKTPINGSGKGCMI